MELGLDIATATPDAMIGRGSNTHTHWCKRVSLAAYEMRDPLSLVVAYVEILLQGDCGPLTARQREKLERIRLGGSHLDAAIERLLDLARRETDNMYNSTGK